MFAKQQQQQHRLFTGVKCIWQSNRPLGYIYFPAKEPGQDEGVDNNHSPVSLMLLVVPTRKPSWLQELARKPCYFHFLAMKDSHTVSVGKSCSGCQRNCSFCSQWSEDPLGRVKLLPHFSCAFNEFLFCPENCCHIYRNPVRTSVFSALQEYLHVVESH